jgi:protein-disulfide isomerase
VLVAGRAPAAVQENLAGYLFALSTIGLAVILYLAYAAFFVLRELCVFCLITYAAVIALFCLSGVATSIPMTTLPRRALRDLRLLVTTPVALIAAVLFLAGAGSAIAFFPRAGQLPAEQPTATALPQDTRSEFERSWASLPRVTVPVSHDGAAVVIVKFTDYQCPACSVTYFELQPILAKYQAELPGAVRLVSKDYPLDKSCNPTLFQTLHPGGCVAAVAVRLAAQHHREAEMEAWLYSNQAGLTPAIVRQAAQTIAGVTDFDQQYDKTIEAVKGDIAVGQLLSVGSTPTFFVNGVRVPEGGFKPAYWDLAIRFELKRAGRLK